MSALEPTQARLRNPLLRYFLATRPPFLVVTLVATFIGLASAARAGVALSLPAAWVTLVLALGAHGAVNVLNDYFDEMNGTDRRNTERIYPYTGGSRFIQNGVLSAQDTLRFAVALFASVVLIGMWLMVQSGSALGLIGLAGLSIGWAYSAPPLRLNSRGLGEPCVFAGFALIAVGADYVQRGALDPLPLAAVSCYAALVTALLYINQFPDLTADAAAGKRHWVVRLGARRARWGYLLIAAAGYCALVVLAMQGVLPLTALAGLASVPLSYRAARLLLRNAERPRELGPAIRSTIAAALANGLLVGAGLLL